jgi:1-deoxy-D-xylulose-5-phosphate synthase
MIEEGAIGRFGAHFMHMLAERGMLDSDLKVRSMVLLDIFSDHDSPAAMYAKGALIRPESSRRFSVFLGTISHQRRRG